MELQAVQMAADSDNDYIVGNSDSNLIADC